MIRRCGLLGMLAAALILTACRPRSAADTYAAVQAAYAAAQSLQWSSEVSITGVPGQPDERFAILAAETTLARPKRFKVAVQMNSGAGLEADGLLGSDGTRLWRQLERSGKPVLLTAPMPNDIAVMSDDDQAAFPDLLEGSKVVNPVRLFYGEADLAGAQITRADEPQTIDGVECDGLTIHGSETWTEHRLWVGRQDHLLRGIDFATGGEGRVVQVSWRAKGLKADPAPPAETFAVPADKQPAAEGETLGQALDNLRYGVGKPAADFALKTVDGQRTVQLSELRGKPVVLDFWATWCGPCELSQPSLQRLHEEYGQQVTILMISDEQPAEIAPVVKQRGLTITQLIDPRGEVAAKYGVEGLPTTIYLDSKGIVRAGHAGIDPSGDLYEQLQQPLKPLLPAAGG